MKPQWTSLVATMLSFSLMIGVSVLFFFVVEAENDLFLKCLFGLIGLAIAIVSLNTLGLNFKNFASQFTSNKLKWLASKLTFIKEFE